MMKINSLNVCVSSISKWQKGTAWVIIVYYVSKIIFLFYLITKLNQKENENTKYNLLANWKME